MKLARFLLDILPARLMPRYTAFLANQDVTASESKKSNGNALSRLERPSDVLRIGYDC